MKEKKEFVEVIDRLRKRYPKSVGIVSFFIPYEEVGGKKGIPTNIEPWYMNQWGDTKTLELNHKLIILDLERLMKEKGIVKKKKRFTEWTRGFLPGSILCIIVISIVALMFIKDLFF